MKNIVKSIVIVFIILASYFSNAQVVKFEKIYGGTGTDYGYSVMQTYDKGYVIAGTTTSFGAGNTDAYILKTDSMSVAQWQKTFGGINIDKAYSIKQTTDTGLIIAGFTNSFGLGGYDMYVIKTNKTGDVIWTKTYGGIDWDFAYSIEQTTDGGYIIAGGTNSYGKGDEDMYLVKTNSIGDTLWTKTYGGAKDDEAKSVKQTSDGGYILTGFTKSMGDSLGDIYTVKTNANGDTLWTYKYQNLLGAFSNDAIESHTGEFIIGGTTKSAINGLDRIIIKLSSLGILINTTIYPGPDDDEINSIVESADGRFAFAGYTYSYGFGPFTSDFFLVIENPFSGTVGFTYGGNQNEIAYCLSNTADGGYIICGNSNSFTYQDHIFLVKTDSNGIAPTTTPTVIVTNINSLIQCNNKFTISPNPANDNAFIRIKDSFITSNTAFKLTITDVLGRVFYQNYFYNNNIPEPIEINTTDFLNGIYFASISNEFFLQTQKIIVQHSMK